MTSTANDKQWDKARDVFIDRMSSRQLFDETRLLDETGMLEEGLSPEETRPLSIGQIRAMIAGGATPFAEATAPVPIGAIRLYRAFLAREGLAFSRHARAASSDLVSRRIIGDYELELVMEDDALFIMISLDGKTPPQSMFLLHEDGRNQMVSLPAPVDDMIQEGLSRKGKDNARLVELLLDPVTSITLI